jgi:hypothetical protein
MVFDAKDCNFTRCVHFREIIHKMASINYYATLLFIIFAVFCLDLANPNNSNPSNVVVNDAIKNIIQNSTVPLDR